MQVGVLYSREYNRYAQPQQRSKADKNNVLLLEIGFDHITTATSFVAYVSDKYGFSRSSVWYNLKKLKSKGVIDFAEKGEEARALTLTKKGELQLRSTVSKGANFQGYGYGLVGKIRYGLQ